MSRTSEYRNGFIALLIGSKIIAVTAYATSEMLTPEIPSRGYSPCSYAYSCKHARFQCANHHPSVCSCACVPARARVCVCLCVVRARVCVAFMALITAEVLCTMSRDSFVNVSTWNSYRFLCDSSSQRSTTGSTPLKCFMTKKGDYCQIQGFMNLIGS